MHLPIEPTADRDGGREGEAGGGGVSLAIALWIPVCHRRVKKGEERRQGQGGERGRERGRGRRGVPPLVSTIIRGIEKDARRQEKGETPCNQMSRTARELLGDTHGVAVQFVCQV